jgi:hypothetical protein
LKFLKNALEELWSLFVDDPAFVGCIVLWAVVMRALHAVIPTTFGGPLLFLGFGVLLIAFACRQAIRLKNSTP